jgi:hypothetical protein
VTSEGEWGERGKQTGSADPALHLCIFDSDRRPRVTPERRRMMRRSTGTSSSSCSTVACGSLGRGRRRILNLSSCPPLSLFCASTGCPPRTTCCTCATHPSSSARSPRRSRRHTPLVSGFRPSWTSDVEEVSPLSLLASRPTRERYTDHSRT